MSHIEAYYMLEKDSLTDYDVLMMLFNRRTPMTLVRWNSGRELASMEIDRLNRMFEDFYSNGRAWAPAVDIYETADREYVIKAELPEMKREDISVMFENNVLTLSGERKAEPDEANFHRNERAHGRFTRSFTLPATVDGN